jgi:hypothetical protein
VASHSLLGIAGTAMLFYGCVFLMAETQPALLAVDDEMQCVHHLSPLYQDRQAVSSGADNRTTVRVSC